MDTGLKMGKFVFNLINKASRAGHEELHTITKSKATESMVTGWIESLSELNTKGEFHGSLYRLR